MYNGVLYRSTDNGYTHKEETITLIGIPELAKLNEFSGIGKKGAGYIIVAKAIVRLHDDSLLASALGRFKGDTNERTFVIRSIDRGKTWTYLSTVAFDLTKGKEVRQEGFSEPDLLSLPNGEVLCFIRSGWSQNTECNLL